MFNKHEIARNACQLYGGNGKGTVKLYRDNKLVDEVLCENVGCEYGEYDQVN